MKKVLFLLAILSFYHVKSQHIVSDVKLLSDLQQKGNTFLLNNNTAIVNGKVFFAANNSFTGQELWATDGTTDGTIQVSDIYIGPIGSNPQEITSFGNNVYFQAHSNNGTGQELWKSDGTTVALVKDINPGPQGSFPNLFTQVGSELFFQGETSTHRGLYKTDGTEAGTVLIKNLFDFTEGKLIKHAKAVGSLLFFSTFKNSTGLTELWKSDGTEAGTILIKSFAGTFDFNSTSFNGMLYFTVSGGTNAGLWKSDGTELGTIKFQNSTAIALNFEILNGDLYYSSAGSIFKINGVTEQVTSVLNASIRTFKKLNGFLYYIAFRSVPLSFELWKYDGTTQNLIKSFSVPESSTNFYNLSTTTDGTIFFNGFSLEHGSELWKTDGTEAGTVMVKDIREGLYSSQVQNFTPLNNTLIFWANDGENGLEPFKSDGTALGTTLLKDIKSNDFNSFHTNFTKLGNKLLFTADIDVFSSTLFATSGLNANNLGKNGASNILSLGNFAYLRAYNANTGVELYKTDGTFGGTVLLKDLATGSSSSIPANLTAFGSNFLFTATDKNNLTELYLSDGTATGTDIINYPKFTLESSDPKAITTLSSTDAYFIANGGGGVEELWRTGGLAANTQRITIAGTSPIIEVGGNANMGVLNNEVYFSAADAAPNYELWKTDGVTATLVAELEKFANTGSSPQSFITVGSKMYFRAITLNNGIELWVTDGTEAGTMIVKDINPGVADADPRNMVALNGILYFSAKDGINGIELWRTDGSSTGTYMLKNIHATGDALPGSLTVLGNALYFAAKDGKHGRELWKTDGTESGTVLVDDFNTDFNNGNQNYSDPFNLFDFNGTLFFSAQNPLAGYEPHYYKPCTNANLSLNIFSQLSSQTTHVSQNINASNTFLQGRAVNYFAGKSISLNPGFSVSAVAGNDNVFRAEIKGCY